MREGETYPVEVIDGGTGGKVDDEFRVAGCCFFPERAHELQRLFTRMTGDIRILQAAAAVSWIPGGAWGHE